MFRISTANRAAQLRSVTAVQGLRFFHRTTSVHVSFPKTVLRSSRSVDTATVDAAPGKDVDQSPDVKPAAGQSSNETLPNEPFIEPKRRLGRPRKDPADNTITKYRRKAKDGGNADEGTKATKARKRTAAKNDTSRDPDSAPGDSSLQEDRPAAAEYGRPALARPKNPSDNMIDWLSWGYGGTWKGGSSIGDRRRMNVVSEDLCDDILDRLGPSLEKHIGCDIIDINPGAGVWSSKVHDLLKPRTHILLEPDTKMYGPLLQHLTEAPDSKYKMIPKSGIIWGHLERVLAKEYLPHQQPFKRDDPEVEQPNNSLLVIANLGYHPKKVYRGFASLSSLVIYQFMSAIKAHSLFQKYGLVRMLIWVNDEEKSTVTPRSINYRRKSAFEADIVCSHIDEVASSTKNELQFPREHFIDMAGASTVLSKMNDAGVQVPHARRSRLLIQHDIFNPLDKGNMSWTVDFVAELQELEKAEASGELLTRETAKVDQARLNLMRVRIKAEEKMRHVIRDLTDQHMDLIEVRRKLYQNPDTEETRALAASYKATKAEWDSTINKLDKQSAALVNTNIDNRIAFYQENPLLLWDRRKYEPLRVEPEEFFPRKEMALFDFQPQSIWPVLREKYPDNSDVMEYILGSLMTAPSQSVERGLKGLMPGAYDWLVQECPSLRNPLKGGHEDLTQFRVRTLTNEMLREMCEAWNRWPFRPTKYELLARMGSASFDPDGAEQDEQLGTMV